MKTQRRRGPQNKRLRACAPRTTHLLARRVHGCGRIERARVHGAQPEAKHTRRRGKLAGRRALSFKHPPTPCCMYTATSNAFRISRPRITTSSTFRATARAPNIIYGQRSWILCGQEKSPALCVQSTPFPLCTCPEVTNQPAAAAASATVPSAVAVAIWRWRAAGLDVRRLTAVV